MRARLATKKLKQLLSPAVQVALAIGVALLQTPEPPPVEDPPLELPALPPLVEPPAPPLVELPAPPLVELPAPPLVELPAPALPPLLGMAPALPGRPAPPALPGDPLPPIAEPPVFGAPADGDAAPADPPFASEPELPPPQPVASSITAIQPLTTNVALAIHALPFVDLMEFYKAF